MTLYLGSEPMSAYISGTENGRTAYVHIKYSNDGQNILANPTDAQRENANYIGFRADYNAVASSTFSDYGWTRIRHDASHLHMRFSAVAAPADNQMTTTPVAGTNFIGLYIDSNEDDSTQASAYSWTRIAYDQCYLHIKYASVANPTAAMMSDDPTSTSVYMGVCWDRTSTAPTTPNSYDWVKVRENIDIVYSNDKQNILTNPSQYETAYYIGIGVDGGNYVWSKIRNQSNNIYVKYATKENGTTYTEVQNPATATYIGICETTAETKPASLSSYNWTQITHNTHIKYGKDGNSGIEFVSDASQATYLGIYTDDKNTDSNDPTAYSWAQIRQPLTYIHIKFATVPSGSTVPSTMTDNPQNQTHIGVCVSGTTSAPTTPASYSWMNVIPNISGFVTQNELANHHDSQKINNNGTSGVNNSTKIGLSVFNDDLGTLTAASGHKHDQYALKTEVASLSNVPTRLSQLTDDLGTNPTHSHSQYLTGSSSDMTAIPTADKIAKFDSNAFMNSTDMTIPEVSSFISSLNMGTVSNGVADWIVDQGVSGIWTYRKWSSGIAECWGYTTVSGIVNGAWGGCFTGPTATIDYPSSLFITIPVVTATTSGSNEAYAGWIYAQNRGSATSTPQFVIIRAATGGASTTLTYTISIEAKGRWK